MRREEPMHLGCAIGHQEAGWRGCPQQGAVLCIGGCLAASPGSVHEAPPPSFDLTLCPPGGQNHPHLRTVSISLNLGLDLETRLLFCLHRQLTLRE